MKRTWTIDFDSTLVFNEYPFIGNEIPNAVNVLKRMQEFGHELILLTMRYGGELSDAKKWLKERNIFISHFNCNPSFETGSRKVYSHYIIDDHSWGIPLIIDSKIHHKPFVDWFTIEKQMEEKGLL